MADISCGRPKSKRANFDASHELEELLLEENPLRARRRRDDMDLESLPPEMRYMEENFLPFDHLKQQRKAYFQPVGNGTPQISRASSAVPASDQAVIDPAVPDEPSSAVPIAKVAPMNPSSSAAVRAATLTPLAGSGPTSAYPPSSLHVPSGVTFVNNNQTLSLHSHRQTYPDDRHGHQAYPGDLHDHQAYPDDTLPASKMVYPATARGAMAPAASASSMT